MKTNDESFEWKIQEYVDEFDLNNKVTQLEKSGWRVHYIDLNESKIIVRNPKVVRLDD